MIWIANTFLSAFAGRGDGTWTHGLFVPNEALYQAELHLEIMGWQSNNCQPFLAGAEGFEPSARGFGVLGCDFSLCFVICRNVS